MIIQSKNFSLKLEEFPLDEIRTTHFNKTEKHVVRLVNEWVQGKEIFHFHTSGSTGTPKDITIEKRKIVQSTSATFSFIDPENRIKSCLLCIDPSFIGGAMVVFRALIKNLDLYIVAPSSNILDKLPDNFTTDLVSMVPLQFQALPRDSNWRFKNILIGGASIGIQECRQSTVYASFGMTETVSHVALRKIHEEDFHTTGDTRVALDQDGSLQFRGAITNYKWLKTNDLGYINSSTSFKWLGRKDFIINSGGVKINPEMVEHKLKSQIESEFIISSIPDDRLGDKVVLLVSGSETPLDYGVLDKFEVPKAVYFDTNISKTQSGKIDRKQTRQMLLARI